MKHQIVDRLNRIIGFTEDETFYNNKDYLKREMFIHPKYENAIGMSLWVLNRLKEMNIKYWDCLILNFELTPFHALIELKDFELLGKKVYFGNKNGDEQLILSLKYFTRRYGDKKVDIIKLSVPPISSGD